MDHTLVWVLVSLIFSLISYGVCFKDIFWGDTKPHPYTFLIWTITQSTATFALGEGEAGWGIIVYISGTIFVFVIFCITFFRRTENITKTDLVFLGLALTGFAILWFFDSPFIGVLIVTAVDLIGFAPTLRKSWNNPWEESLKFWAITMLAGFFFLLSLEHYNRLTLTYSVALDGAILVLIVFCLIRRRKIAPPDGEAPQ